MDPSEGIYWRTYMDSGEYGFGLFLSPLVAGVDCPMIAYATFLPAMIADDQGNPYEIPDAICIFDPTARQNRRSSLPASEVAEMEEHATNSVHPSRAISC